jgi:hypothetical protein
MTASLGDALSQVLWLRSAPRIFGGFATPIDGTFGPDFHVAVTGRGNRSALRTHARHDLSAGNGSGPGAVPFPHYLPNTRQYRR